ncbi:MAG TPA: NAD(P)H-binding protein [Candidatus Acidoferrales bacterium]|nr:NAD(P)H-binding protein [Candidatus Acidoferrales bacterium]
MILVTGATGNVGSQVARTLARSGAFVRVLTRNPDHVNLPGNVDVVRGDFTDPETLARTADGADGIFLMLPAMDANLEEGVKRAAPHVERIAFLSSALVTIDASNTSFIAQRHAAVENAIKVSGTAWTILRPGYFAANALRWWLPQLRTSDVLRWPYPTARFAPIHERDMAEIAVLGLTSSAHANRVYDLTGPAAVTAAEQLEFIGRATRRNLRFEEVTGEAGLASLSFLPPQLAQGILASWEQATRNEPFVTQDVARVLGKPARSFEEWASDNAAAFAKSAA